MRNVVGRSSLDRVLSETDELNQTIKDLLDRTTEGEAQSAGKLAEAADVIAAHPVALQLRNLQVLAEIAVEKNSTILFPAQFLDSVDRLQRFVGGEQAVRVRPLEHAEPGDSAG